MKLNKIFAVVVLCTCTLTMTLADVSVVKAESNVEVIVDDNIKLETVKVTSKKYTKK